MRTVLAFLLVGCGGYDGAGGIALGIDAPGAALVVLQDGDQPFRPVPLDESGAALVSVKDGSYGVGVYCPFDSLRGNRVRFVYDTEAGLVSAPCTFPEVPFVRLSGTTEPGAEVWVGQAGPVIADETGAYDTTAPVGDLEIIALLPQATPPRMFLRRVTANADRVVDLPVATDGVDLIPVTPTVTNALQGEYLVSSDLNTPSTFIQLTTSDATTVHVPPPSILEDGDHAAIAARADDCTVQQPAAVIAPTFRVPSPLVVSLERTQVAWTADPTIAWERTVVRLSRPGALGTTERGKSVLISSTPSWHAERTSDVLPIVDPATEIPGWNSDLGGFVTGDSVETTFSIGRGRFDGELVSCGLRSTLVW